ncbi:MAG: ATP-binding protein [Phycisphaerales bacterium]|nr:ATP-binding protein [Phycisphaerales bacterium]
MGPLDIGHVIKVQGDTLDVQIGVESLEMEANGKRYRVGRLGTYATVPVSSGLLIGYVTGVTHHGELEPRPNPGAPRKISMTVQLLGTVRGQRFQRGVDEYPTLGDVVRLGTDADFALIFGTFDEIAREAGGYPRSFSMGRFAVDTDFDVRCLGRDFFTKHVAVMGNSGSGKSVTTAKILYEALKLPFTQVVMFDMHGEYSAAFSDDAGNPQANVSYLSDRNLILPYWMLRYEEFEQVFLDTSDPLNCNAQRVFLRQAFERLKRAAAEELELTREYNVDTPVYYSIEQLKLYAENMNQARYVLGTQNYAFTRLAYRTLPPAEQEKLLLAQRMEFNQGNPEGEVPHATFNGRLLGLVNQLETRLNDRRYDFLLRPFEQARRNPDLSMYFRGGMRPGDLSMSVSAVIRQLLGRVSPRRNLTIIDLSGLPFDVVDITVATLTRALFEFNFWSPPEARQPVLLCFEEAHNYLPRTAREGRKMFAREAVEKVAKEGRKYGVAAMIVSQRPSEISETVLSQCNTMVLMRMNNPDDQQYASRVVSDQFRSLIDLLPSMRPGEGFIIGDSVMMPMRTLIDPPPRLPRSANVDFFRVWSQGAAESAVEQIVDRWWRQDRSAVNLEKPQDWGFEGTLPSLDEGALANLDEQALAEPLSLPANSPLARDGASGMSGAASRGPGNGADAAGGESTEGQFVETEDSAAEREQRPLSVAQRKLAQLAALLSGKKSE